VSLDLSWITDELAIGGRFARDHVDLLAREHRVAAIVDLRAEDCDDVALLAARDMEHLHLPTPDHHGVSLPMLREGVAFVTRHVRAGRRVLVHCEHGIGRSALLGLCVLVEDGHAPLVALALAKSRRARVSPSPMQFEAWVAWLRERDHPVPSFEEFAAIAYRGTEG
jgi:protein-tyrosine phosphatase